MEKEPLLSLKKRGHRITSVRRCIVEFLSTRKKPYDAVVIQAALAKTAKKVNKTTVYREIEFLLSENIIKRVNFGDGKNRYEIADLPHHHHLVCEGCNTIEDVVLEDELQLIEKRIAKKSKFKVERHALEFFGMCSRCSTN
jgi:Fur family transcriptional regulator, ferric uptake regulator